MPQNNTQQQITFEQALNQLETIVSAMEQGKIGLQDMITEYEKGMKLVSYCRGILSEAEAKIQQLQVMADGKLSAMPLETPDAG